ncbi:MAG: YdcF family protein [Nitrospiria bacterium]
MSAWVYIIYKIVKVAVYPLSWVIVLLGLSVAWSGGRHPARLRACLLAALILSYGLSIAPVSRTLAWTLEHRYPEPADLAARAARYDAVVVLAGGVQRKGGLRTRDDLKASTLQRLLCGRSVMRQGVAPMLVLSGGNADPFREQLPESVVMAQVLRSIERSRWIIRTETHSRTTFENAVETKKLLADRSRIALVTSALHMPRAMAMFTRQGFQATAYPCEFSVGNVHSGVTAYLPDVDYFRQSSMAIHEWVGLGLYRLAGKAD